MNEIEEWKKFRFFDDICKLAFVINFQYVYLKEQKNEKFNKYNKCVMK